jgi:hypothetical protein
LQLNLMPRWYLQEQDIVIELTQGDLAKRGDVDAIVDTVSCAAAAHSAIPRTRTCTRHRPKIRARAAMRPETRPPEQMQNIE